MRVLYLATAATLVAQPLKAQFGTAAATPPAELPRRGADIKAPKVRRHYSKRHDVSGVLVVAYVATGYSGDVYTVTCGYAFRGKIPPARLDSVLITISHAEPFGDAPDDALPSLTIDADTLHTVVRQVVSTSAGSLLEYDHQLHYRLALPLFRAVFDADSADLRVRRRTYRMRGRSVEVCRWFGDQVAGGPLLP